MLLKSLFLILVGISSGLGVAAGTFAFLFIIRIIPRMIQKAGLEHKIIYVENMIFRGVLFGTILTLFSWKKKWLSVLWRPVTLLIVLIGFVFFRAETLADAAVYLGTMFTASPAGSPMLLAECLSGYNVSVILLATVLSLPVVPFVRQKLGGRLSEAVGYAGSVLLFAASVMSLASSTFNPFIYFRF